MTPDETRTALYKLRDKMDSEDFDTFVGGLRELCNLVGSGELHGDLVGMLSQVAYLRSRDEVQLVVDGILAEMEAGGAPSFTVLFIDGITPLVHRLHSNIELHRRMLRVQEDRNTELVTILVEKGIYPASTWNRIPDEVTTLLSEDGTLLLRHAMGPNWAFENGGKADVRKINWEDGLVLVDVDRWGR